MFKALDEWLMKKLHLAASTSPALAKQVEAVSEVARAQGISVLDAMKVQVTKKELKVHLGAVPGAFVSPGYKLRGVTTTLNTTPQLMFDEICAKLKQRFSTGTSEASTVNPLFKPTSSPQSDTSSESQNRQREYAAMFASWAFDKEARASEFVLGFTFQPYGVGVTGTGGLPSGYSMPDVTVTPNTSEQKNGYIVIPTQQIVSNKSYCVTGHMYNALNGAAFDADASIQYTGTANVIDLYHGPVTQESTGLADVLAALWLSSMGDDSFLEAFRGRIS